MCDPIVGGALAVGSAVMGYRAEKKRVKTDRSSMEAEADVADKNAALADFEAELMVEQGKIDSYNVDVNLATNLGQMRTSFAGGNVVLDVGTPLLAEQEATTQATMEKQAISDKRAVDIYLKGQEAEGLRDRARKLRRGIGQMSSAGKMASAARLSGGLAQAASIAMQG